MTKVSIGRAWDETARMLGSERRLMVPIALAFLFLPATLSVLAAPNPQPTNPASVVSPVAVVAVLLGLVGRLAISLLATGWQGKLGELIGRAGKRLLPLIVSLAIVLVPLAAMFVIAGRMLPEPGADPDSLPLGQALTGLALMVAVLVFTLLAAARLILPIVPLTAIEDGGPVANLKHSWQISQGNFWRLLAVVLLTGLAAVTLLFATQSVVGSVATLLLGKPDPWTVSRLIVALAVAVVQTGVVTVASVLVARVYVQLAAAAKA